MTQIPYVNSPVLLVLRWLLRLVISPVLRLKGFRISGKSNLPARRRAAIIICNHAAFIDSVYLISAVRTHFTICGAKPKYFEKRMVRFLFRTANILKVENEEQFINDCLTLLRLNDILLIYPEMGRNKAGIGPFKDWAAQVALKAGVPVIPCYLYGTAEGQKGPVSLYAGKELMPSGNAEALTSEFRKAIEQLRPEAL